MQDSQGNPMPGYCSHACGYCPVGYVCTLGECRFVAGSDIISGVCADFCGRYVQLGCTVPAECPAICAARFLGADATCTARLGEYMRCITANTTSCGDVGAACDAAETALGSCGCNDCTSAIPCNCAVSCNEKARQYVVDCSADASGTISCTCTLDGIPLGTCTDSGTNSCDPFLGCCFEFVK